MIHENNTGNNRCKGSDKWQEPRKHNSTATMFFIKLFCLNEVVMFEEKPIFPAEHGRPDLTAKPIACHVA